MAECHETAGCSVTRALTLQAVTCERYSAPTLMKTKLIDKDYSDSERMH